MNKRMIAYLLIIFVILAGVSLWARVLKAQEKGQTTMDISGQLQQIIQNQQLIISKLNQMQEELRIIKIRSTIKR